jgi:hypothetical protein
MRTAQRSRFAAPRRGLLELRQARVRVGRVVARALLRKDPSVTVAPLDRQLDNDARI